MKLFVIGDADAVLGFSLVGLTGQAADTPAEVEKALDIASQDPNIGAIIITERAAAFVQAKVDAMRMAKSGPLIVELPGSDGPLPDRLSLRDVIARATGVRV